MVDEGVSLAAQAPTERVADRWWVALPLLALLLISPTLVHGRPFVFWDTVAYYDYGSKLVGFALAKVAPSRHAPQAVGASVPAGPGGGAKANGEGTGIAFYGSRSPYYSASLYSLARALGLWAVLLAQAAVIAWGIWLVATQAFGKRRLEWAMGATALATFGAQAWFPAGFVMPDAFAAVALAGVALLFAYADRMSRPEQLAAVLLVAMAAIFHLTHLLTVVAVAGAGVLLAHLLGSGQDWLPRRALVAVASALALVAVLQAAFDMAARAGLGANLKGPPFVMARIIADGPGRLYLRTHCARGAAFAVCAYRDRTFSNSDEFLWSGAPTVGVFQTLPLDQRLKLIDEETRFVAAVALAYPLEVLKAVTRNTVAQFALVSPEEAFIDSGETFKDKLFREAKLLEVAPFLHSCVERPGSCVPKAPQGLVAALAVITILASLGTIAAHGLTAWRRGPASVAAADVEHRRALVFAVLIVAGLVVNAALCGAISGPHARYQVRVAWLAVVAAAVLEAAYPIVTSQFSRLLRWQRM